jgi:hypothetical protein
LIGGLIMAWGGMMWCIAVFLQLWLHCNKKGAII